MKTPKALLHCLVFAAGRANADTAGPGSVTDLLTLPPFDVPSDGSGAAIYGIRWSRESTGCSSFLFQPMVATCPVGAILLQQQRPATGSPDDDEDWDCQQVDDVTVRCGRIPRDVVVYVACYTPPGYAEEDLYLTAKLERGQFTCNRQQGSGGTFMCPETYYGGSVTNMLTILHSFYCDVTSSNGDGMEVIREGRKTGGCSSTYTCSGLCPGSAFDQCNASDKSCTSRGGETTVSLNEEDGNENSSPISICVEDFTTSLALGESCESNVRCASNICIDGICRDSRLNIGSVCEEDDHCESPSACAFIDYDRRKEENARVCCAIGSFEYEGDSYCINKALAGASCGPNLNQLCQSGICYNSLCQAGKLPLGQGCDDPEDCESNICSSHHAFWSGKVSRTGQTALTVPVEITVDEEGGLTGYWRFSSINKCGNKIPITPEVTLSEQTGQPIELKWKVDHDYGVCGSGGTITLSHLGGSEWNYLFEKFDRQSIGVLSLECTSIDQGRRCSSFNPSADNSEAALGKCLPQLSLAASNSASSPAQSPLSSEPTEMESLDGGAEDTEQEFSLYSRTSAIDVAMHSGVSIGSSNVGSFDPGDWMTYSNVWFGSPGETARIRVRFAKGNTGGMVEVRLGDRNGRLIGTFTPWNTGGWNNFAESSFAIDSTVEGLHALTFVGLRSNGIMVFNWFELAPPIDPTSYTLYGRTEAEDVLDEQGVSIGSTNIGNFDRNDFMIYDNVWFGKAGDTNKIRIRFSKGNTGGSVEVRLDGKYGKTIGTFTPWNTGGWSNFAEGSFEIDSSIEGLHRLAFIGLGSYGIMVFDWFELASSDTRESTTAPTLPPASILTPSPDLPVRSSSVDSNPTSDPAPALLSVATSVSPSLEVDEPAASASSPSFTISPSLETDEPADVSLSSGNSEGVGSGSSGKLLGNVFLLFSTTVFGMVSIF